MIIDAWSRYFVELLCRFVCQLRSHLGHWRCRGRNLSPDGRRFGASSVQSSAVWQRLADHKECVDGWISPHERLSRHMRRRIPPISGEVSFAHPGLVKTPPTVPVSPENSRRQFHQCVVSPKHCTWSSVTMCAQLLCGFRGTPDRIPQPSAHPLVCVRVFFKDSTVEVKSSGVR